MEVPNKQKPQTDALPAQEGPGLIEMIRERLDQDTVELPTLPEVSMQVLALSRDPDATLEAYAALIEKDPAMAAKAIRLVNTGFYRGLHDIISLPDAIKRLGLKGVTNVAISVGLHNVFHLRQARSRGVLEQLWRRSLSNATASYKIARVVRYPEIEEAFLAGLVSKIGRAAILMALDRMSEADERVAKLADDIQEEALAILDHQTGARLLANWSFPAEVVEAINYQGDPAAAPSAKMLAWIVCAANQVSGKLDPENAEADRHLALSGTTAFQALGLEDLSITKLLVDVEDRGREVQAACDDPVCPSPKCLAGESGEKSRGENENAVS